MSGDGDPVSEIEVALEHAGRLCRNLLILEPHLTHQQVKKLAQWLYGCMNQRYTIRRRVAERGVGELPKALEFFARACSAVLEIEEQVAGRE